MKQFRFFFWMTVVFMVCCAGLSVIDLYRIRVGRADDILMMATFIPLGLALMSPVYMIRHVRGSAVVRGLFVPASVAVALICAYFLLGELINLLHLLLLTDKYTGQIATIVGVIVLVSWLLFVIACFCVKARPLRWWFRIQGVLIILWIVLVVTAVMQLNRYPPAHARLWNGLITMANTLVLLPLLLLNYTLWRKDPAGEEMKEAVAALGTDQTGLYE
jgi:hypothetical protein